MFVNGVPCGDGCGRFIPVHFGDTVRKNTMSIEFGYDKEQVTTILFIILIMHVIR